MKTLIAFSRVLLLPCALSLTVSCDVPGDERIIDPNAEAEYREPAVPQEHPAPSSAYPGAPAPERAPSVARNPDAIGDILDRGIEDTIATRGPEILDSILGEGEDAQMIRSILEQAPAMIEEIMARTNGGTEIPPEVIDEARDAIAYNGPIVIDEMIRESGEERPVARAIGEIFLQVILDALDSRRGYPQGQGYY